MGIEVELVDGFMFTSFSTLAEMQAVSRAQAEAEQRIRASSSRDTAEDGEESAVTDPPKQSPVPCTSTLSETKVGGDTCKRVMRRRRKTPNRLQLQQTTPTSATARHNKTQQRLLTRTSRTKQRLKKVKTATNKPPGRPKGRPPKAKEKKKATTAATDKREAKRKILTRAIKKAVATSFKATNKAKTTCSSSNSKTASAKSPSAPLPQQHNRCRPPPLFSGRPLAPTVRPLASDHFGLTENQFVSKLVGAYRPVAPILPPSPAWTSQPSFPLSPDPWLVMISKKADPALGVEYELREIWDPSCVCEAVLSESDDEAIWFDRGGGIRVTRIRRESAGGQSQPPPQRPQQQQKPKQAQQQRLPQLFLPPPPDPRSGDVRVEPARMESFRMRNKRAVEDADVKTGGDKILPQPQPDVFQVVAKAADESREGSKIEERILSPEEWKRETKRTRTAEDEDGDKDENANDITATLDLFDSASAAAFVGRLRKKRPPERRKKNPSRLAKTIARINSIEGRSGDAKVNALSLHRQNVLADHTYAAFSF